MLVQEQVLVALLVLSVEAGAEMAGTCILVGGDESPAGAGTGPASSKKR